MSLLRSPRVLLSLGSILLGLAACSSETESDKAPASGNAAPPSMATWFEESAAAAGVDFKHESGADGEHWFPEIMGGGVCLFDYDADGDLDLYVVQSGDLKASGAATNRLFRNDGAGQFDDVTGAAGVGHAGYGMGACTGDYDGDGDTDLYVTNVGPNALFRNEGDGTFREVAAQAGVDHAGWGTSCAFLDYDLDGLADLFLANNLVWSPQIEQACFNYYGEEDYCSPNNYNAPAPDVLYHGKATGVFEDVSAASGISTSFGNGLGVVVGDYDNDGDPDLYVANDARPNQLWRNEGGTKFTDQALISGTAVNGDGAAEAGMGVQFVDAENDGDLDLFMTHLRNESNTFYVNQGGGFRDMTRVTGMLGRSLKFTGFGTGFADFDHDGELDLFIANGAVQRWKQPFDPANPYAEANLLFRGMGGTQFEEIADAGLAAPLLGTSRGAAFGDLDADGDIDVVVVELDGDLRVLKNVAPKIGGWVRFAVLDGGDQKALGARVRVKSSGAEYWRVAHPAYSYLSSNDPGVHFGLSTSTQVDEVLVIWNGGTREVFGPFPAGAVHELRAGAGRAE